MSPDAFARLLLIAAASAWIAVLGCVWIFLSPIVAILMLVGAPLAALVLSLEDTSRPPVDDARETIRSGENLRLVRR